MKNKIWQGLIIRLALISSIIFQLVDLVSILVTKPRNQKAEGVVIKITKITFYNTILHRTKRHKSRN